MFSIYMRDALCRYWGEFVIFTSFATGNLMLGIAIF